MLIGVIFILISTKFIHKLGGIEKFILATFFAALLGYYFVLTNIYILKKSGALLKALGRKLDPHKAGHAALLLSAVILGYGYSENHKSIIWLGLGGIFFANYLLTIVRSQFDEILVELHKEDEARKTKDIEITVSPSATSKYHYLIAVNNKSTMALKNVRIFYEPFILDAENFGTDTTHMPTEDASVHDEPVLIESINKNETIKFVRKGWGSHEKYDGPKKCAIEVGFPVDGKMPERKDRKWCLAKMALPNARNM